MLPENSSEVEVVAIPLVIQKYCCSCFSISHGLNLIGAFDILVFMICLVQTFLLIFGKAIENTSFLTGQYLFTTLPSLFLIRIPRNISFIMMINAKRRVYRYRTIYFRIRLTTFVL